MIEYSARSHVGRVRENNEDNLYVDGVFLTATTREFPFAIDGCATLPAVFAVCDGMGGEDNGELASMAAVWQLMLAEDAIKDTASDQLDEMVQQLANEMTEAILSDIPNSEKRSGTTLALAIVTESGICCFNIGDSRIYVLHRRKFKQVTHDHTPGGLPGNRLTRCIGIGGAAEAEGYPPLPATSRILICSDGLTDMVDAAEIKELLRASGSTAKAADALLSTALAKGGRDNVTVIVADVKKSSSSFFRSFKKRWKG